MAIIVQVAASNELPENEELDALYDRFLIRRQVAQVSSSGLRSLLQMPSAMTTESKLLPAESSAPSANGNRNGKSRDSHPCGLHKAEFSEVRCAVPARVDQTGMSPYGNFFRGAVHSGL